MNPNYFNIAIMLLYVGWTIAWDVRGDWGQTLYGLGALILTFGITPLTRGWLP